MLISEKEYVIGAFQKNFGKYAGVPMALYGIGKNTKYILDNFPEHNIIGLMDEARTGDTIYGVPVLPFAELVALGVGLVVIVARAANVRIIYRRIAEPAEKNSIPVYDINGNRPDVRQTSEKRMERYAGLTEKALEEKIDRADAVSFDIFDTLLMRRCLYPQDIFRILGDDFAQRRIHAEMELYAEGKHPNIYDIYERMGNDCSHGDELRLESDYLVPRAAMVRMLRYAAQSGKQIFLTSDMYLTRQILAPLLNGLGIHVPVENILVSCDCGVSKVTGLFGVLRQKAGDVSLLHIGDNLEADILPAQRFGIDTFHMHSALAMLEDGYGDALLRHDGSLQNRMVIGNFIARQLNDPFLFGRTRGKFEIVSHYDMAHSFIAPLIVRAFNYLADRAKALDLDVILLASRDGYLFDRLYHMLKDVWDLPSMRYFYVSRAASVVAGMLDEKDILHAAQLAFSGTAGELLKERFHLPEGDIQQQEAGEKDDDYIRRHQSVILQAAAQERERYRQYIGTFGIRAGARVGFFDFVSSGTSQKALSGIVDFHLVGLYVAAINYATEYKTDTEIHAMYGVLNVFKKTYALLENYFFMENILTSYEPSLWGFDDSGAPRFLPEHRSDEDFAVLREVHRAILDYAREMRDTEWSAVDISLPDCIFGFISNSCANVNTRYFEDGELRDEFCNRKFSLALA